MTKHIPATIDEYLDDAKAAIGTKSDRELGRLLGMKGAPVTFYRRKKTWPYPDTMKTIAEMGGHDPVIAVMQLHAWRETGPVGAIYRSVLQTLTGAAAALGMFFLISGGEPAQADQNVSSTKAHEVSIRYIL